MAGPGPGAALAAAAAPWAAVVLPTHSRPVAVASATALLGRGASGGQLACSRFLLWLLVVLAVPGCRALKAVLASATVPGGLMLADMAGPMVLLLALLALLSGSLHQGAGGRGQLASWAPAPTGDSRLGTSLQQSCREERGGRMERGVGMAGRRRWERGLGIAGT